MDIVLFTVEDLPYIRQSIIDGTMLYFAYSMAQYLRGRNNWLKKLLTKKKQNDSHN